LALVLDAIAAQSVGALEVVVVHSGSPAPVLDHPVTLVHSKSRLFASAARNLGAMRASGDVLLFIDSDIVARPDVIERHEAAHRAGFVSVQGSVGYHVSGGYWGLCTWATEFSALTPETHEDDDFKHAASCNYSIRRSLFFELGGFDPEREHAEDVDLLRRLRARRIRTAFVPKAIGGHCNHATFAHARRHITRLGCGSARGHRHHDAWFARRSFALLSPGVGAVRLVRIVWRARTQGVRALPLLPGIVTCTAFWTVGFAYGVMTTDARAPRRAAAGVYEGRQARILRVGGDRGRRPSPHYRRSAALLS
jgi:GT2 family glycosyltransferase